MGAMGWGDIPENITSAAAGGELDQAIATLASKDASLHKVGFEIEKARFNGFQMVRREIEGKKGKGTRLELHFAMTSLDENAARKMEAWMLTAGASKAKLDISYTPAAVQESFAETEDPIATDEQRQAVMDVH
jgi:hypothetical protein